jgi:hypothetical protein
MREMLVRSLGVSVGVWWWSTLLLPLVYGPSDSRR